MDRTKFTKWNARTVSDALRRLPGVTISLNPNYNRPAQGSRLGALGGVRGRTKMGIDTRKYVIAMRKCQEIGVWLDGVLIGSTQEIDVDGMVSLGEIEAIEAFRGPSEIPARFSNSRFACGALVLWTREGGPRE